MLRRRSNDGQDPPLVGERDDAALGLVAPFVQPNLRALEQRQLAQEPRLVRRADDGEVGFDLGAREVVVDEDRRRGVDVDVEPHALENRIALLGQVQLAARGHRRQQAGVEVDVARQPGFVDRHLSADEDLVAVLGDLDVESEMLRRSSGAS